MEKFRQEEEKSLAESPEWMGRIGGKVEVKEWKEAPRDE